MASAFWSSSIFNLTEPLQLVAPGPPKKLALPKYVRVTFAANDAHNQSQN